tara:strand:+ start:402 stop:758 length:357 start_codon:yes stop_codon:yes gene_type:complete
MARDFVGQVDRAVDYDEELPECPDCGKQVKVRYEAKGGHDALPWASCECHPDPADNPIQKAPQRQQLPSGKIIDHCSDCDKYGVIWSGSQSQGQFCRDCDGKKKAAKAGIDAMRGGEN